MKEKRSFLDSELKEALTDALDTSPPDPEHSRELKQIMLDRLETIKSLQVNGQSKRKNTAIEETVILQKNWEVFSSPSAVGKLALVAAALVVFAVLFNRLFDDTAYAGLVSSLEKMKQSVWIHGITTIEIDNKSTTSESWVSPAKRIAAGTMQDSAYFIDYQKEVQSTYNESLSRIVLTRAEVKWETAGYAFVDAILQERDLKVVIPQLLVSKVRKKSDSQDGLLVDVYSFSLKQKSTVQPHSEFTIRVDRKSNRILEWRESSINGAIVMTRFDYPVDGPGDIHDLNIPRDVEIVDRVAPVEVVQIAKDLEKQISIFGDYQAIVVDEITTDASIDKNTDLEGRNKEVLIRRLNRKGPTYRMEHLRPNDSTRSIPEDLDWAWFERHRDNFDSSPMIVCDGSSCLVQPIDPEVTKFVTEVQSSTDSVETIMATFFDVDGRSIVVPAWPSSWPEFACRPMLMSSNPELRYSIDTNDKGVSLDTACITQEVPDYSHQFGIAKFWLSKGIGNCLTESRIFMPKDTSQSIIGEQLLLYWDVYSDYRKSPSGVYYASERVQRDTNSRITKRVRFFVNFEPSP